MANNLDGEFSWTGNFTAGLQMIMHGKCYGRRMFMDGECLWGGKPLWTKNVHDGTLVACRGWY